LRATQPCEGFGNNAAAQNFQRETVFCEEHGRFGQAVETFLVAKDFKRALFNRNDGPVASVVFEKGVERGEFVEGDLWRRAGAKGKLGFPRVRAKADGVRIGDGRDEFKRGAPALLGLKRNDNTFNLSVPVLF
jgi:hypothetical protein